MFPQEESHTARRQDRRITFQEIENAARSFWRRIPMALLASWFGLSLLIYTFSFWQDRAMPSVASLLSVDVQLASVHQLLGIALAVLVISLVQAGLYLPAKLVNDGERVGAGAVLRMAAARLPTLVNLSIKIGVLLALVGVVAFSVDPSLAPWAVLPLAFLLEPAKYYATAHRMSAREALGRTLSVSRRHWLPIMVVFGALTGLSAALPALIDAAATQHQSGAWALAAEVGRLCAHLTSDFVGFVASCGLFFALDDCEQ
jgi:hypothetical protein